MIEYVKLEDIEAVLADKHMNRPLDSDRWVIGDIGKSIADLPTTEIVRCKDCKHWYTFRFSTQTVKECAILGGQLTGENDYCCWGKKQVTGKLKNADDSLLTADSDGCKEQKSKLESVDTPTDTPTNTPTDAISRKATIEAIEERFFAGTVADINPSWRLLHEIIESLPSAEPQRPKGEWKFSSTFNDSVGSEFAKVKCSHCGYETFALARFVKDGNFCPNCGSYNGGDMRGEDND